MGKAMDSAVKALTDMKRLDAADGIVLRPVRLYHGEEIHAAVIDSRDSLARWLPWAGGVSTLSDTRDFIRHSMDRQAEGAALQLGVWADGSFSGVVGLHAVDWENRRTSIGYWLTEGARGRGVMTACVRALTGFALCRLDLNRVEIECAVENALSRAIPQRLGYTEEGTAREDMFLCGRFVDLVTYAALAREWPCDDVSGVHK